MTSRWVTRPLGEMLQIQNGFAFDSNNFGAKGLPLIRIRDLKIGTRTEVNFDGSYDARYLVDAGDLMVGMDGDFRCHEWRGPQALLNQRVCRLQGFTGELLPRFLFHGINKYLKDIEDVTAFATVKHLSSKQILGIKFPAPPVEDQRRIVTILDEAFAGIATAKANAERSLYAAREVFDLRLSWVFSGSHMGWAIKRLDELCSITSSLVDPHAPDYIDAMHVGAGNIESKTGRLIDLMTSRQEGLISGKFPFDSSMVLYSKIRPYLMKVARPDFTGICSADMYPLTPIDGLLTRDFLYYLLLSKPFTDYAINGSARAGMPKVNRDHLFRYETTVPSVKEQTQIASELDELVGETQHLQSLYTRKLAALDELRQSLLQQAFSGQL